MLVLANKSFPFLPKARIPLGYGLFAIVDPEDLEALEKYRWFPKKSAYREYACRSKTIDGKKVFVRMHRQIAKTPPDMVCHHINGNSLDNRKSNLQNMLLYDHIKMHSYR